MFQTDSSNIFEPRNSFRSRHSYPQTANGEPLHGEANTLAGSTEAQGENLAMKRTSTSTVFTIVVIIAGLAGAYAASPALRARVARETQSLLGWTEVARRADPEGFTNFVESRLSRDLEQLQETRRGLAVELGSLVKQAKEQQLLLDHAEQFAGDFRQTFQQASDSDQFPVTVRNAEYSKEDVVSQVSLLLAEADGYRQSIGKLDAVRRQAEQRLEQITVRLNSTQTQLASIATQRGLLRARKLSDEGERLVAQVDQLLNANQVVMHANPVRSVRELLASSEQGKPQPRLEVARQFLITKPETTVEAAKIPVIEVTPASVTKPAKPAVTNYRIQLEGELETFAPPQPNQDGGLIFQQK
jgi:hypothetical protein